LVVLQDIHLGDIEKRKNLHGFAVGVAEIRDIHTIVRSVNNTSATI
jgi:hypothetical protein